MMVERRVTPSDA